MASAALIVTALTAAGRAQMPLTVGVDIAQPIAAGERHQYTIELSAGDLVSGFVDQRDLVVFATAYHPDGSLLRPFPGPYSGRRSFAFIADTTGRYRLDLRTPSVENAAKNGITMASTGSYVLRVDERRSLDERLRAAADDPLTSPRLEAWRLRLRDGSMTSAAFWAEVRREQAPLVEPLPGDARSSLVTFLWQGDAHLRNVAVVASFSSLEYARRWPVPTLMLRRLDTTDIWHATVKLPARSRFTYRFSPNDPVALDQRAAIAREANLQIDPLNARRTVTRQGATKFDGASIAELPGAPPQRWIVRDPAVAAGSVTPHRVPSARLNGARHVWIYTPPHSDARGGAHNLVVLFDGEMYNDADQIPAAIILDNLIAAGAIGPTVAVFVSSSAARAQELLVNDTFTEFVASELVPWVRSRYNVSASAAQTVIGGASAGGVAAAYAAFRFPTIFGKVLSQSGAFDWAADHPQYGPQSDATTEPNGLAAMFRDAATLPIEFYLEAGTFEVDLIGSGGFILEPTRHLRDVLRAKGYRVHYRQVDGGHEPLTWRGTLADGLVALLGPPATPASRVAPAPSDYRRQASGARVQGPGSRSTGFRFRVQTSDPRAARR